MKQITAKQVEDMVKAGENPTIIDVRETEEVEEGKIPGAINIPLGLIEFRTQDLDKEKEYIIVCRSGGRSSRACQFLDQQGFKVINMEGGMLDWQGATE